MDISNKKIIDIRGSRITVLGIGRSGLGAARLAKYLGADVFISDGGAKPDFEQILKDLQKTGIIGEYGGHSDRVFDADLVIISPGIPCDADIVKEFVKRDITIVGEVEFSSWFTNAPIVAVTGSNGKTTTVFAINHMLEGSSLLPVLAGNMGTSFSDVILSDLTNPVDKRVYVLEISSFQMEFIHHFKPSVAVFLNITPDHLDRHGTMEVYSNAKFKMASNMSDSGTIVYNTEDDLVRNRFSSLNNAKPFGITSTTGQLFTIMDGSFHSHDGKTVIKTSEAGIPGLHNVSNLLAAATAVRILGIPDKKIFESIRSFKGVPHRMEYVETINGVDFINDSKATNVDAVKVAITSYTRPLILLLGGKDKAGNFKELIPLTHNIQYILAFGKARDVIAAALVDAVRLMQCISLKDAVVESKRLARPGDVVLLSPGCASFDEFNNFEERGNFFKEIVKQSA